MPDCVAQLSKVDPVGKSSTRRGRRRKLVAHYRELSSSEENTTPERATLQSSLPTWNCEPILAALRRRVRGESDGPGDPDWGVGRWVRHIENELERIQISELARGVPMDSRGARAPRKSDEALALEKLGDAPRLGLRSIALCGWEAFRPREHHRFPLEVGHPPAVALLWRGTRRSNVSRILLPVYSPILGTRPFDPTRTSVKARSNQEPQRPSDLGQGESRLSRDGW